MKQLVAMVLAGLLLCIGFQQGEQHSTMAQTTDGERAFVYGINAAIPGNFVGTFAPPSADAIFLLADGTSVISPRFTEIYFWPITNEFTPTDYTILFSQEETTTTAELFLGQAAIDAEANFRARQEAFNEASAEYQRAERAWLDAVAEANARQQAGETVALPPAPVIPEPIGIFSNGLNQGIPIDLDPGQYDIWLRDANGDVVPGSERTLTVFAARRTGVGYTVVPETRWTTPLDSPAPSDVIVGAADSTLYLEPHLTREYPAREWALLQDPQAPQGDVGGWQWVQGERLEDQRLEIVAGEDVVDQR
ncbi:MAG: hypothetical protein K0S14_1240 [Thermomicrobiales bacterium]|nr:hypothetical protein [Thermomicrobiales bacterium]